MGKAEHLCAIATNLPHPLSSDSYLHFYFQFSKHLLNHYRCPPFQREVSISFQVAWIASYTLIVSWFTGNLWVWTICHKEFEVLLAQLCLTLCDPMNYSLPGSSVHEILQSRILEWEGIPFSSDFSRPRDWNELPCIAGRYFTVWAK